MPAPCRRRPTRTTPRGTSCVPEDPDERLDGSTRSPATSSCSVRADGERRLRVLPARRPGRADGIGSRSRFAGGAVRLARNERTTPPPSPSSTESYVAAAGVVRRRPAHRARGPSVHRRRRRATTRPATSPSGWTFPAPDGTAVAGDPGAAPRHPARRHRAGAALRLRRLRVAVRARVGPGAAEPARPRGGLRARPHPRRRRGRPPLVARRPAASTSSTRSTTTSRSPTAWRAGCRRRPDRHPRPVAPAGCCRARCSASARTAGGRSWRRCRSSTSSPRCSTPRSR